VTDPGRGGGKQGFHVWTPKGRRRREASGAPAGHRQGGPERRDLGGSRGDRAGCGSRRRLRGLEKTDDDDEVSVQDAEEDDGGETREEIVAYVKTAPWMGPGYLPSGYSRDAI
jgi:hypothetical protein